MEVLYPMFVKHIAPFFIGKDARDIEELIPAATVYENNYKAQGLAIWVPIATIEFAILDMFGKMSKRPIGLLISDKIYNTKFRCTRPTANATSLRKRRSNTSSATSQSRTRRRSSSSWAAGCLTLRYPVGRSEKLIPLVRKTFGDQMMISADANGSYTAAEAIPIGKLMQEYKYAFYEEPVPFDWYEDNKVVADALEIPIAGGEQEPSTHNFRWLIANGGLSIVQQDMFYFGGMIRCMQVARMANAFGKQCIPHISSTGLGYVYMMHFVSAIPNSGPYHEFKEFNTELPYHCETSSLRSDSNGVIQVPSGPGFGVDIDPDFLKKCTVVTG